MPEQQQKQITNIESCRRLQALSSYRESENDLFQAISVLNDALFYLNPQAFSSTSEQAAEALRLKTEIRIKQVELYLRLKKPARALPTMLELMKSSGTNSRVQQLVQTMVKEGIKEEELRRETRCQ